MPPPPPVCLMAVYEATGEVRRGTFLPFNVVWGYKCVYRGVFLQDTWFLRIQKLVLMSRKICTWAQFMNNFEIQLFHISISNIFDHLKVFLKFKQNLKILYFFLKNRVFAAKSVSRQYAAWNVFHHFKVFLGQQLKVIEAALLSIVRFLSSLVLDSVCVEEN